ncbi:MAG: hypothetical protein GY705_29745 [Bacteroidetes bacterium]|nr:hypothetical protein [Bacteroidota bacterium]
MNRYRYPGAQPFTYDQKSIFFGRDADIQNLHKVVKLEKLVVLYSKSGLGKSSLINAGLIPQINKENRYLPISIRFGPYLSNNQLSPIENTILKISDGKKTTTFLDKLLTNEGSLWYHLKELQINRAEKKEIILIFDQFEELFTYPKEVIHNFKKEVASALYTDVPENFRSALEKHFSTDSDSISDEELELLHKSFELKVLFAIRSDQMSHLNKLQDFFPNILNKCYELGPLSRTQAEDAMLNPAYKKDEIFISQPFDYEDNAIDNIFDFLTKGGKDSIESFQLQILCQSIERKVIKQRLKKIKPEDIGNIESIYKNYYFDQIGFLDNDDERKAARRLIEEGLIFEEEERRLTLYEGQIEKQYGVKLPLLKKLVDSHLLRAESSAQGGYTYELSHDTLVAPVLKAKAVRKAEEERENIREEMKKKQAEDLEKRQREQEKIQLLEEKSKKRRITIIATVSIILLAVSTFAFYFAYQKNQLAEAALDEARVQQKEAEFQRRKAEKAGEEKDDVILELRQKLNELKDLSEQIEKLEVNTHQKSSIEESLDKAIEEGEEVIRTKGGDTPEIRKKEMQRAATQLFEPERVSEQVQQKPFDVNDFVRKDNQYYLTDPKMAAYLIALCHKNFDNDEGIKKAITILAKMEDEAIIKNRKQLSILLSKLEKEKNLDSRTKRELRVIKNKARLK